MRRILIIVLALALLLAIGLGVYFLFFSGRDGGIAVAPPADPFGTSDDYATTATGDIPVGQSAQGAGEEVGPSFFRITEGPVAQGVLLFPITEVRTIGDASATSSATTTVQDTELRYVERATGNIYAFRLEARTLTRLTNETLPGVQEAVWVPDGSLVYLRFLSGDLSDQLLTYAAPLSGEGYFLETNLSQLVITGSSTAVTLLPSASGSVATMARADGSVIKTLFSSDLSQLRIAPAGNTVAAYTKASASTNGYGFLVNGASGVFEPIAGPQRGLTLLPSNTGKTILVGYRQGNVLRLELVDAATRATTPLPVSTLPEKCVWTNDDTTLYCAVPRSLPQGLPDAWYQGGVSTSDRIWRISLADRVAVLVVDPRELSDEEMDITSLSIDRNENALGFLNRKDGSLWMYDL